MSEDWAGKYYETEGFEFPLWKRIKDYAEEKDISYLRAAEEIAPLFAAETRIKDIEFEDEQVEKRRLHFEKLKAAVEES
jgi:hypothetical protein